MILLCKSLLGTVGVVAGAFIVLYQPWFDKKSHRYDKNMLLLMCASRVGVFLFLFIVIGISPRSDVTVYYREAHEVLSGQIPLVDIRTAYGPLFDYLAAATIEVWDSAAGLVALAIIVEIVSLPIWMRVGRAAFTERQTRIATALYIANPLAISTVVIAGQNHVGLSLLLALSFTALMRKRDMLSGIWLGISIIAVKFLSLVFMPVLLLASKRRISWAAGFSLFPLLGYGMVVAVHGHPLSQLIFHANDSSSGNVPYLLGAAGVTLTTPDERLIANVVAFVLLCAIFLFSVWRFGIVGFSEAVLMCAFVFVLTMVINKKAFASYLIVVLFPVCLAMAEQTKLLLAVIYLQTLSALATIEPSLWFRWMGEKEMDLLLLQMLPDGVTRSHVFIFFVCDVLLVIGYVVLLILLWLNIAQKSTPASGREALRPDDLNLHFAVRPDGADDQWKRIPSR